MNNGFRKYVQLENVAIKMHRHLWPSAGAPRNTRHTKSRYAARRRGWLTEFNNYAYCFGYRRQDCLHCPTRLTRCRQHSHVSSTHARTSSCAMMCSDALLTSVLDFPRRHPITFGHHCPNRHPKIRREVAWVGRGPSQCCYQGLDLQGQGLDVRTSWRTALD